MPIKIEMQVDWGKNYSSASIFEGVVDALGLQNMSFEDGFEGGEYSVNDLLGILGRDDSKFYYLNNHCSIFLRPMKAYRLDRLVVCPPQVDFSVHASQFSQLAGKGFCIWGRLYDEFYDRAQNEEDLNELRGLGVNVDELALKSNGMPPPLKKNIADISKNLGRHVFADSKIQAAGSVMWLTKGWCECNGVNLGSITAVSKSINSSGVLINFYERCFDSNEGQQGEIQQLIWKELYDH